MYAIKGALAGPNFSTDLLGTYFYRTFFGYQLQVGDPQMGATVASAMFVIILAGVRAVLLRRAAPDAAARLLMRPSLMRPRLTRPTFRPQRAAVHAALLAYTALALAPILLIMVNAFKPRRAIFGAPLTLPGPGRFSLAGFEKVLTHSDFGLYVRKLARGHGGSTRARAAARRHGGVGARGIPLSR